MSDAAAAVSLILRTELALLLESLKRDTEANFKRKRHNFLLSSFDADALFYAVFTSSFESKSGNALERCSKRIARLRYGPQAVPPVIAGLGATAEDAAAYVSFSTDKQVILTRKRINKVQEHAASVLSQHRRTGRGAAASQHIGLTQNTLQRDILAHLYSDDNILHAKPVDLYVHPPDAAPFCMEIKLGGDLDNSNAPAQIAKLLTLCALTGKPDVQGYFATIYNKDGEGNRFSGVVTSYLAGDMILPGSAFWNLILPTSVSFDDFHSLYAAAWKDVGMNDAIRTLIARLVPSPAGGVSEIVQHLTE